MLTIDYNSYRTTTPYGKRVRFLVLHYTALDFAASVKALTTGAASAHYLIPAPHDPSYKAAGFKGQRIFNLVAEEDRAWHAGVSGWARRDNLNDTSIGIEIV
ncbi:N-acetylmuramoyl-L-alanine amidase, partial [Pseudomonas aeruginosa]